MEFMKGMKPLTIGHGKEMDKHGGTEPKQVRTMTTRFSSRRPSLALGRVAECNSSGGVTQAAEEMDISAMGTGSSVDGPRQYGPRSAEARD